MEGLRGFAVLLVFCVHYHALFSAWAAKGSLTYRISDFFSNLGESGVDLFFVLSGYLIYGTVIRKQTSYLPFMKRRIQRIYPTFLVVFVLYVALSFVIPGQNKIPHGFSAASLYLVQNLLLLPGIFDIPPFITVAWSLSYEMFFYILIPLLVTALSMRSWSKTNRSVFFIEITFCFAVFCLVAEFSHFRLIMFVSGILVYEAIHSFKLGDKWTQRGEWRIIFWFLVTFPLIHPLSSLDIIKLWPGSGRYFTVARQSLLSITFFLLVVGCFTSRSVLKNLFSWAPLRWLGNMSYSYYLIHGLVLKAIHMVLRKMAPAGDHPLVFWVALPFALVLTLAVSTMLFLLVEKRFSLKRTPREPEEPKTIHRVEIDSNLV